MGHVPGCALGTQRRGAPPEFPVRVRKPGGEGPVQVPRGDAIHADPVPAVLYRHVDRQGDDPALGSLVGDVVRPSGPETVDGRHVDDGSAPRIQHRRYGEPAREHHGLEVHRHDLVPVLLAHVHYRAGIAESHVVEEDVQPAVPFHRGFGHGAAVRRPGHVPGEDRRGTPFLLDGGQRLSGVLRASVRQQHLRAFPGEEHGGRLPGPRHVVLCARARHDGHLAVQAGFSSRHQNSLF